MNWFKKIVYALFLLIVVILAVISLGARAVSKSLTLGIPQRQVSEYGDWRSYPVLVGGSDEQNEKVLYAWEISHDIEFIFTLNGENGDWTEYRIHDSSANDKGVDYGFGINSHWHPEVVNDPRFFTDWKWQIGEAWRLYSTGTPFWGYSSNNIKMEG